MESEPSVAIIILNWNRWRDTIRCLESIYQSTFKNFFIILIDNGSTDGSLEKIKGWAAGSVTVNSEFFAYNQDNKPIELKLIAGPGTEDTSDGHKQSMTCQLTIIANDRNFGFAEGNNIGIKYAVASFNVRYVALLNNDIVLHPQCLRELIIGAENDAGIGSCQPKMLLMDTPELIDTMGISMLNSDGGAVSLGHGLLEKGRFHVRQEIFGVCAGAALYRRSMLDQIGLFDKAFFAYYEDVDLALRSCMAGWKALYVPEAIVYHGHSSTLGKDSPLKTYLLERNRYYYLIKNVPCDILLHVFKTRPVVFFKTFFYFIKTGQLQHLTAFLLGNMAGICHIPQMFLKRWKIRSSQNVSDDVVRKWFLP